MNAGLLPTADPRPPRTHTPSDNMITPHGPFRLPGVTTILLIGSLFYASLGQAGENRLRQEQQIQESRIAVDHARVRRRQVDADASAVSGSSRSIVAQAAHGRVPDAIPHAPLDGSLVRGPSSERGISGQIERVGYQRSLGGGCGPVCDCGNCDPGCGIEPVCGSEVFVDEPVCGFEVGCGIGAALERLGPACGIEGCADCCESACGVEGVLMEGPGCGMEVVGECGCDACVSQCDDKCIPLCLPILRVNWNQFQFFAGTQGFKGPLNFASTDPANAAVRNGSGSFGFYQGFNEGRSLKKWLRCDLAAQFGLRATQSNLSGAEFTQDTRYQIFLTYGWFRRVDYGMQYGLVLDYLNDDWYYQFDLLQLRGEMSWRTRGCHVYGFQFMAPLNSETSATLVRDETGAPLVSPITVESTDQYRLFYRQLLRGSGVWDSFAGWTGSDDGLLGSTVSLPVRRNLVLQAGSTYLIPKQGTASGGNREEGWNISLGMVYRPGGPTGGGRYSRPMFDVADNGTFMVDLK
jgi:hypothetical protein